MMPRSSQSQGLLATEQRQILKEIKRIGVFSQSNETDEVGSLPLLLSDDLSSDCQNWPILMPSSEVTDGLRRVDSEARNAQTGRRNSSPDG